MTDEDAAAPADARDADSPDDDFLDRLLDQHGDPSEDVFRSGLREIVALRAVLVSLESELVVGARLRRHSWRAVGDDLGLSPGGARRRHLAVDPPRTREPYREASLAEALAHLIARPPA